MRGRFIWGDEPLDLIEEITWYTGRMQPLPEWVGNGAIVGYEGGTQKVVELWKRLKAANVPIAGFWLQDWSGVRVDSFGAFGSSCISIMNYVAAGTRVLWNWQHSEARYPGWDQFLQQLAADGVKVSSCISTMLVPFTPDPTDAHLY